MNVQIIHGDARSLPLEDDSVDLIVTSPPYFGLRSYTDGGEHYDGQIGAEATPAAYIDALIECTREWMRVLKSTGSIFVNLGDKYSQRPGQYPMGNADAGEGLVGGARSSDHIDARRGQAYTGMQPKSLMGLPWRYALVCIDELGLILRAEVIWSKPNGLPESVTDRVRRSHEHWFHLVQQPRYYSAVDAIREPHAAKSVYQRDAARSAAGGHRDNRALALGQSRQSGMAAGLRELHPIGKLPGSVWEVASQPLKVPAALGVDHFAAFPIEWPRRIIAAWSPPGGVVLDPFGGTGTTALAADVLGRTGISVDMSADYCEIARWRTADPGERARAMGVAKPAPVMAGQTSLLDNLEAP